MSFARIKDWWMYIVTLTGSSYGLHCALVFRKLEAFVYEYYQRECSSQIAEMGDEPEPFSLD
jgi:hypothetical protein